MILQWVMKHCLSEGVIAAAKVVGQHCPISVFCLVGSQDDKSRQQPPSKWLTCTFAAHVLPMRLALSEHVHFLSFFSEIFADGHTW